MSSGLIDVHAHPDGMGGWPSWSVKAHLDLMDRNGIETAMLSMSSPGVHFAVVRDRSTGNNKEEKCTRERSGKTSGYPPSASVPWECPRVTARTPATETT
ncbi:hypothetical protein ACFZCU_27300 [Streptomyces canus]|jgi:hypothetical protein|uniref:hypothetical protein n=1 Tax=Streptomyces canus TaxID=58343 RepID=UPI0036EF661C